MNPLSSLLISSAQRGGGRLIAAVSAVIGAATPGASGLVVTDDFNRANGAVGANYTIAAGALNIVGNQISVSTTGADQVALYTGTAPTSKNQYVEATITGGAGEYGGLILRGSGSGGTFNAYAMNRERIFKFVNGGYSSLTTFDGSASDGVRFRFEVEEADGVNTLRAYKDDVLVGTVTDSDIASVGTFGLIVYTSGATVTIDDFEGGELAASVATTTYYIDWDGGSDANDGTSKLTAWKRHPYMAGFSGTHLHRAGNQYIFKGGVTWPAACFPFNLGAGGSVGNIDYYGVDLTWFTGGAWSRPKLDVEYSYRDGIYLANLGYITIDRFEICHVTWDQADGNGCITGGTPRNILITGCHLHGWQTTSATDGAHGGIIFGTPENVNILSIVVEDTEIENSENLDNGVCARCVGVLRNCEIHSNSSAVLFAVDMDGCDMHDIAMVPSFDGDYHVNGFYCDPKTQFQAQGWCRNNKFHNISGGANAAYLNPREAEIDAYNNVFYGEMPDQRAIEIEPYNYGATADTGTVRAFNNTGFLEDGTPLINVVDRGGAPKLAVLIAKNNHVIGTGVAVHNGGAGTVAALTVSDNLIQTAAAAAAEGYVEANEYAPGSAGASTVGAGADLSEFFTTDINGNERSGAWDIGAYQF